MRNVYKGFQVSHLAVPKTMEASINNHYSSMHGGRMPRASFGLLRKPTQRPVTMPGKNPGTKIGKF